MCGRFVTKTDPAKMAQIFDVDVRRDDGEFRENYNVAPSQRVYVVTEELPDHELPDREQPEQARPEGTASDTPARPEEPVRTLDRYRWGLIPHWAKDAKIGYRMINARAETVATKNAFKGPFRRRRCIVPADGFYEWKRTDGSKQPFFIHSVDGMPLAFAGLWDTWKDKSDPEAEWVRTCSIITTDANASVASIHDRMPVILPEELWAAWLDPEEHDPEVLRTMLVPASEETLEMYPVTKDVGSVRNNSSDLLNPVHSAG